LIQEDGFRFVLEKSRFIKLLKILTLDGMCSNVDIVLKNGKLCSRNYIDSGTYSISSFKESFFLESDIDGHGCFSIDVGELRKTTELWLKELKNGEELTIVQRDEKLHISSELDSFTFDIKRLEEYDSKIPFSFESGVPIIKHSLLKLDTHFLVNLADVKGVTRHLKKLDLCITFAIKNGELYLFVWDKKDNQQVLFTRKPQHKIFNGKELSATFTPDIAKIFQAFTMNMIHVHTKTEECAWFSEDSKDYAFGVMFARATIDKPLVF